MSNNDDFTFCQVGPPVNPDTWEPLETFPNIGGITIKEGSSNEASIDHMDGFIVKDSSLNSASSNKQKTVGSLSFNVIDMSATTESSTHAGDSGKASQGQRSIVKKPAVRAKVPFEKGYSPMDWFRLNRTHPDLAGLKGQSNKRLISMEEVEQHQKEGSIWTVLKGRVYNISPYMKFHPGGVDKLMSAAGKDCTSMFNKYHAWVNAEFLMEKCLVGTLDDNR
ncbi:cytochrome b5 domain-containing protein RLF-like [Macadamia integrifolia]|uniref:cytochrome b5 domain-containing protein RLF-like n=1 Tax=Macadamia integrifolia TaxID=60698 RepID=UPI001C4F5F8D|nr:cytochrome b5 domain-containing protein RLF-like [Macadamia integrifolia]XP_042477118.1 cytochrome b5 domain-containing protein RLF-like [Macadamia integrifolia]XP_042477121.1 cytochrome b5 domain-containing protein RLF-like [Macadamia integrifolia]